jgi:hypothetical protein
MLQLASHLELSMSISYSSPVWMSWWDRYFAPGDLRRRQQTTQPSTFAGKDGAQNKITSPSSPAAASTTTNQHAARMHPSHRTRRQNALFFGGLTFSLLSVALTRRTILRKRLAAWPATFTPSHMHIQPPPGPEQQMSRVEGSLLAIEALGLATLNVCSFFMAGIGGAMMWFDVAEMEDLRRSVGVAGDGSVYGGVVDEESEREVEGWIAGAFGGGGQHQEGKHAEVLGAQGLREAVLKELEKAKKDGKGRKVGRHNAEDYLIRLR